MSGVAQNAQKGDKNAEEKAAIVQSLKNGTSKTAAYEAASVPHRTFYEWLKTDPEFKAACEAAEAECKNVRTTTAVDILYENLKKSSDDPRYQTSLIFWLKSNAPEVYGDKQEVKLNDERPVKIIHVEGKPEWGNGQKEAA